MLFFPFSSLAGEELAESLFEKVIGHFTQDNALYPSNITEHETVFSKDGKIEEETVTNLRLKANGKNYFSKVDSCFHNGKQLSKHDVLEIEKELNESEDDILMEVEYIFLAKNRDMVTLNGKAGVEKINGKTCEILSFTQTTSDNKWTGKAWIEQVTGIPVKIMPFVTFKGKAVTETIYASYKIH